MPKFNIEFKVNGKTQTITAVGNKKLRAGSKNYWYATFTFLDNSFDGLEYLSASFSIKPYSSNRTDAIIVPIENNECQIPWEMLTKKRKFYVGVFAGDMLVTNEEVIEVTEAALTGGVYTQPTTSWFDIFLDLLRRKQDQLIPGDNIAINRQNRISAILTNAVLYSEQRLEEDEMLQARENIGAGTYDPFKITFVIDGASRRIDTPVEKINQALAANKPLWAIVDVNGDRILLKNVRYNERDDRYLFWDVISETMDTSVNPRLVKIEADFINLSFSYINTELALEQEVPYNVVQYSPQFLSNENKLQARQNIGAGTDETHCLEFELRGRNLVLISSYEDFNNWRQTNALMCAKVTILGEVIYLNNFANTDDDYVFFWNLIPPIARGDSAQIQYMCCSDNGVSLIAPNIAEASLGNKQDIDEELAQKADKVERIILSQDGALQEVLEPDKVYWFTGDLTSLNIILDEEVSNNEEVLYHFYFKSGDVAPQIRMPSNIGYASGAMEAITSIDTIVEVTISKIPTITINERTYSYLAYAGRLDTSIWR